MYFVTYQIGKKLVFKGI